MACERPFTVRNPKGGTLKAICGTCRSCLIQDIKDWTIRLENENKHAFNGYFVTLTYNEKYNDGNLHKEHVQEFIKRLRYLRTKVEAVMDIPKIKYFAVGEYGENYLRPHYHLLLFNIPADMPHKALKFIQEGWNMGFVSIDEINRTTIQYVCKYIFKQKNHQSTRVKPFRLMSTRPAIGESYLTTHPDYHLMGEIFYTQDEYKKVHLPRYYSDRIFDDEFKERRKEKAIQIQNLENEKNKDLTPKERIDRLRTKLILQQQQNERFNKKMNKNNLN
jgi:hypothetical protein